ncbi:MAG: hypothetical protein ACOYN3_05140 [Acidimicrobiia bacterium]
MDGGEGYSEVFGVDLLSLVLVFDVLFESVEELDDDPLLELESPDPLLERREGLSVR